MGQAYYDPDSQAIFQKFFKEKVEGDMKDQMDEFKQKLVEQVNPNIELIGEVQAETEELCKEKLEEVVNEFLASASVTGASK